MSTAQIRGYSLRQTARYLESKFDSETRKRVLDAMPATSRTMLASFESGEWYPRDHSAALFRAIAAARGGDAAYDDLVACGEFIASEATNTFLRLLMRIMTPTLFAKKVPEFWKRDQRGGAFEVDVSDADKGRIGMSLVDVAGYDHIGIVSIGWIQFGMAALGKKGVKIEQEGWSLANPGPREVRYQVTWS
ncbi:MAG: hypothetical protein K8M05_09695 [Deltaproteobacteria bacterium]|nr:hypothetical protein [Kofleriaceae bacterium]